MGTCTAGRHPLPLTTTMTVQTARASQAKQRHHLYLEKRIEHVHTTQSAAADRFSAFCTCLGFGGLHGGHWIFLALKARAARAKTHIGDPAQPRIAQVVPLAAGQEIAVFVEPPAPRLGCALCGKAVACDPCGIDFSFGPQSVPCDHAFCRHCLEAELTEKWGCPTCGDNPVWKFETRWKGERSARVRTAWKHKVGVVAYSRPRALAPAWREHRKYTHACQINCCCSYT